MKTIIFIALTAYLVADTQCYDLESYDINMIMNNIDEFKKFIDCELDRGECSKLYSSYRAVTLEATEEACKKCNPYQKGLYWLFLQGLKAKFPSDYISFRNKYDPENKYFDALEAELEKYAMKF